jgi:hypothetical protein
MIRWFIGAKQIFESNGSLKQKRSNLRRVELSYACNVHASTH